MANSKIVNALNTLRPPTTANMTRIDMLFGDQPDVLDAILDARKRHCSFRQIAIAVSTDKDKVSPGAIQNWLATRGVK